MRVGETKGVKSRSKYKYTRVGKSEYKCFIVTKKHVTLKKIVSKTGAEVTLLRL